jgi:antirestriction protein ArdC
MTFKQALELGANVRKGEHGHLVVYAYKLTKTEANANGEEAEREIAFMKGYTVFNVDQMKTCPRNTRPSRNRHISRPRSPCS